MIDGFRPRKRGGHIRPVDRHLVSRMVVGGHHPSTHPHPTPHAEPPAPHPHHPAHPEHAGYSEPFATPQDVESIEEQNPETNTTSVMYKKEAEKKRSFKAWLKARTKKQWIIFGIIAALVLGGGGVGAYFLFKDSPKPPPPVAKKIVPPAPPEPTTVASNLTGIQVDPRINEWPVTGIMIENSLDARPQSALEQAGVVFEAIAEGGITRFLTLFQDTEPAYIGPVRSVRPYYIQWAQGFDAPIAHVGGSPEALANMKQWGAKDLDQFAGAAFFERISSRYAPHNVYTSMAKLRQYESSKGYGKSNYTSLLRKPDQPAATPTATAADFNVSGASFNPHYDYDRPSNTYKRSEGGAPHMTVDANGGQVQLAPKVVVALVMPQGANGKYTTYQTIGSGAAFVFQDGLVTQVTWKKDNNQAQFNFTDAQGAPFKLNAGQTWFTVVGDNGRVTYK